MKKCVIIPDSFKGTLSSIEICKIMKSKILEHFPLCEAITIPIADGGEGTVDCFLAAVEGRRISLNVTGPYREQVPGEYARIGDTAVIEMAKVAGLPLVEGRENPAETTTYGVGELIKHAVLNGCKEIIVGLGGSCTNDGGAGMASALGVKFLDHRGAEFLPIGATLDEIKYIDISMTKKLLNGCHVTAMCDIDNPMFGKNGAAFVYAPQKGADPDMVKDLDHKLRIFSKQIRKDLNIDVSNLPGAGAAGALGAGIAAFLNGDLRSGIQTLLDLIRFEDLLKGADLVFTGEGKIDGQSIRGKTVVGIAERAFKLEVPVIAIVGDIADGATDVYDRGVSAIFSINRLAIPYEQARFRSKQDLASTMHDLMRFMSLDI